MAGFIYETGGHTRLSASGSKEQQKEKSSETRKSTSLA
jgi:hypothetical protein